MNRLSKVGLAALPAVLVLTACSSHHVYEGYEWFQVVDGFETFEGDDMPAGPVCKLVWPDNFDPDRYTKSVGVRETELYPFDSSDAMKSENLIIDFSDTRTVLVNPREMDRFYTHHGADVLPGRRVVNDIYHTAENAEKVVVGAEDPELSIYEAFARVRYPLYGDLWDSLERCWDEVDRRTSGDL